MTEKSKRISWNKGRTTPEEVKAKMRASHNPKSDLNLSIGRGAKGRIPWNKGLFGWNNGHVVTEETRRKISENRKPTKGPDNPRYGIHLSEETKAKLRASHLGKRHTPAARDKMKKKALKSWSEPEYKEMRSGKNAPRYNKPHTDQSKAKLSAALSGEKNPSWNGGISKFPYTQDWTEDLKDSIRKRDGYRCQFCSIYQEELKEKLHVHHINYDKEDCNPSNLISLCRSCHTKTNWKRKNWIEFFCEPKERRMNA